MGTAVPFHHFSVEYIYKTVVLESDKARADVRLFDRYAPLRRDCERLVAIARNRERSVIIGIDVQHRIVAQNERTGEHRMRTNRSEYHTLELRIDHGTAGRERIRR